MRPPRTIGSMSSSPERSPERPDAGRIASHLAVMAQSRSSWECWSPASRSRSRASSASPPRTPAPGMVNLPESLEAKDLSQKTRIYDVNGNLIASLYDQNRINVRLKSISRPMVKSIVAIEDYRFYQHGALDIRGTLRAFVTNQANGGSVQGGSSITQQMVKQTLLYQAESDEERAAATEETYARKVRELRYAIAFEKNYTKDWILERYLNIAYFGDGAYGVQSAARHFFSKNAKDLNLLESATLAGLVKNPIGYDPIDSPERAESRRNVVLDRMAQLDVLTAEAGRPAEGEADQRPQDRDVAQRLPAVPRAVLLRLRRRTTWSRTRPSVTRAKERRTALKTGGLTIQTTLDLDMQKAADDAVVRPRLPHRPGHRRPGDGRARHRRRTSPGAVAADGQGQGGRRDLPQLRRPQEVRRRQRLPGRIDLQGLRPRRRPSTRRSRSAPGSPPRRRCTSTTRTSRPATAPTPATARAGTRRTRPARAPSTSTPAPSSR